MQTILTWIIIMVILCVSIIVLTYVAHRGQSEEECEGKKLHGCDGNCGACGKKS